MPHKMSFLVCSKRGLLYEIENCSLLFVWNSTVLMQDNEQLHFCLWGKMRKKSLMNGLCVFAKMLWIRKGRENGVCYYVSGGFFFFFSPIIITLSQSV